MNRPRFKAYPFEYRPAKPDREAAPGESLLSRLLHLFTKAALSAVALAMISMVLLNYRMTLYGDGRVTFLRKPSWMFEGTFAYGGPGETGDAERALTSSPGDRRPSAPPPGDLVGTVSGGSPFADPPPVNVRVLDSGSFPSSERATGPLRAQEPADPAVPGPARSRLPSRAIQPPNAPAGQLGTRVISEVAASGAAGAAGGTGDPSSGDRPPGGRPEGTLQPVPLPATAAPRTVDRDRSSRPTAQVGAPASPEGDVAADASMARSAAGSPGRVQTTDPDQKRRSGPEAECALARDRLSSAVARAESQRPGQQPGGLEIFKLIERGFLDEIPSCPDSGEFRLSRRNGGLRIRCTIHGTR